MKFFSEPVQVVNWLWLLCVRPGHVPLYVIMFDLLSVHLEKLPLREQLVHLQLAERIDF